MKLLELFSSKPQMEIEDEGSIWTARQKIGDRYIEVWTEHNYKNEWGFEFLEKVHRNAPAEAKLTGSGNEIQVFNMVVNAAIKFVEDKEPDAIVFSAKRSENRTSIYKRIVERLIKKFPSYTYKVEPEDHRFDKFKVYKKNQGLGASEDR